MNSNTTDANDTAVAVLPDQLVGNNKTMTNEEKANMEKERVAWARQRKMEEVVYNDEGTDVVSISGLPLKKFVGKMLISFCRSNNLPVKSGLGSKKHCVDLIIAHKNGAPVREAIQKGVQGRKHKGTKPPSVTCEGTIYRVILTILHPKCRDIYLKTLSKRDRKDLDSGKIPHHAEWEVLSKFYCDVSNAQLDTLGSDEYFVHGGGQDESSVFDDLSSSEFRDVVVYVNYHYDKARKNKSKSGNHSEFSKFIENKGWLLFYHNQLKELGDTDLSNAAYAELPSNVFAASSSSSMSFEDEKDGKVSPNQNRRDGKVSPNQNRREKTEGRAIAFKSIAEKNHAIAMLSRSEILLNQEKRLEEVEDKLFELNKEYNELKLRASQLKRKMEHQLGCSNTNDDDYEDMKGTRISELKQIKRRKHFLKVKIARNSDSLSQLKKEMNYKEPNVEDSSSSDDD